MRLTDDGARRPGLTPVPEDPGKARDLLMVVAVCAAVALVLFATNGVDRVYGLLADRNATAPLVVLVLIPVGVSVFALRRFQAAEEAWKETARLSMRDALTGLAPRRFLTDHFEEIVRRVQRHGGRVAIFFCDLDKFKLINDTYGHEMGDRVMVKVAERLCGTIGDDEILIRYGGDEFVVLSPNAAAGSAAERAARRLIEALDEPFAVGEDKIKLSVSVGVALSEEHCTDPDDVLRDADAAMCKAKAMGGGGQVALYDRSMSSRITPSTAERRLRTALAEGQFRLYFQPIVSLQSQRMVKVEALIRWADPDRGIVSPKEFIPALEKTGLIVPVGTWVLEQACRQAHEWAITHTHQSPLMVTVNVSARQISQADFCEVLRRVLEKTGVDPATICLEITEGAVMADVDAALTMLRRVKALGVYLAVDDFGTGFSSLSFLRRLRPDIVKIDKLFVDGLGQSREDTTIIEHVVGMARGLGMVTVAEGVETADQVRHLRSLTCHMAQGFFYSKPQPPAVIDRILAQSPTEDWRSDRVDEQAAGAPVAPAITPTMRTAAAASAS
jgi:diguanylate cyclase (GGDEF)-like protein